MDLFTRVEIPKYPFQISHGDHVLFMGSCFSDHIGKFMSRHGFNVLNNPFGVLYNPYSIAKNISLLLKSKDHSESDLRKRGEKFFHFDYHGSFSSHDPKEALGKMNQQMELSKSWTKEIDHLIITWGSAFTYRWIENNEIVANCHKIPEKEFKLERLNVEEIVDQYISLLRNLKSKYPKLQVLFTVSPVRHRKYGDHGNQISKSILHLAQDKIIERLEYCHYFPSYEIYMDELRDYRFYKEDLVHPSDHSVEYVYEKFSQAFFTSATSQVCKEVEKLQKAKDHKILFPGSPEHIRFIKSNLEKAEQMKQSHPLVKGEEILNYFTREWDNIKNKL